MTILDMLVQRNCDNKIDTETLLEKLSQVVGLEVLEKVVSKNFDRRLLLEKIAIESHISEEVLLRKLAKRLHWNYLDEVKGFDFRDIYEPLMLSELRHFGIMPLKRNHSVIGYVCCDPSLVPEKYCNVVNQKKIISSLKNIDKALDESEKLSKSQKDAVPLKVKNDVKYNALILDEDTFFCEALENVLKDFELNIKTVSSLCNFLDIITDDINLVFCSSDFMGGSWHKIVKIVKNKDRVLPSSFVLITPSRTQDFQIEAMSAGVDFCISKKGSTKLIQNRVKKLITKLNQSSSSIENNNYSECVNY